MGNCAHTVQPTGHRLLREALNRAEQPVVETTADRRQTGRMNPEPAKSHAHVGAAPRAEPLSAPWRLRFDCQSHEIRLLVRLRGQPGRDQLEAIWWASAAGDEEQPPLSIPAQLSATPFGPEIFVARFTVPGEPSGGRCQVRCGEQMSSEMIVRPEPAAEEPWRFLIASDYQNDPAADLALRAIERFHRSKPLHGLLFPGDLVQVADDLESWISVGPGSDSSARPFLDRWGLLRDVPIFVAPGNHEVSSSAGKSPAERAENVSPADWNLDTCEVLFLPAAPDERASRRDPRACYRVRWGPLDLVSIFVASRWVRGNHRERTGPAYEAPGRFIYQQVTPDSSLHRWLGRQIGEHSDGAAADLQSAGSPLRLILCHHPPFAQGINAVPPFDDPLDYKTNTIAEHLVPLISNWADGFISGHNHIVNHHRVGGVHYLEASHLGVGKGAAAWLPDGRPAPEPQGHPSCFFASETQARFFAVLEVCRPEGSGEPRAGVVVYRVEPGGHFECDYEFTLKQEARGTYPRESDSVQRGQEE